MSNDHDDPTDDTDESEPNSSPDPADQLDPANGNDDDADSAEPADKRKKRKRAGGRGINRETWERIVQGYRDLGRNHKQVAIFARVNRQTVTKAWNIGLDYDFARTPIKDLLQEENRLARAVIQGSTHAAAKVAAAATAQGYAPHVVERLATNAMTTANTVEVPTTPEEAEMQAWQAKVDAIKSKTEKTKAVRVVRNTLTMGIVQTARMAQSIERLMKRYEKALDKLLPSEEAMDADDYKPDLESLRFVGDLIRQARDLQSTNVTLLERVTKAEEAIIGKEDVVIGGFDGDYNDALDEFDRCAAAVDQIRAHQQRRRAASGA